MLRRLAAFISTVHFIPYVFIVEVHFLVEVDFHFSFAPSVMKKSITISKFNYMQNLPQIYLCI